MLNAIAKTPTMLYYLDNYANTWPRPNENYAREVLELHTLGAVHNYYGAVEPLPCPITARVSVPDIQKLMYLNSPKALTGWGVSDTTDGSPGHGGVSCSAPTHYNDWQESSIKVMDVELTDTAGEADVTDILDYLAGHYGTAQYIAWKLCTRLIGDNPPQGIVDSTADEFYNRRNQPDQLKEVCRHVLESSEFQETWGAKVARPVETLMRAWRATGVDLTMRAGRQRQQRTSGTGSTTPAIILLVTALPPVFPDEREMWQGSGPLIMSWRVVTLHAEKGQDREPGGADQCAIHPGGGSKRSKHCQLVDRPGFGLRPARSVRRPHRAVRDRYPRDH